MAPITTARLATCVVAATLVSAAAATLPTEALADDGPVSVPSAPVTAPSLDTGAVLAGEASAAVEGAIGDALGEATQATEQAAPGSRLLLDAAFLVPTSRTRTFRAAVKRKTKELGSAGVIVSLTGPWPPYNFISPSAVPRRTATARGLGSRRGQAAH